jgi:thiamine-phosphate pyrophosphorylase
MAEAGHSCRLYLTLPAKPSAGLGRSFAAAIAGTEVTCALLRRDEDLSDDSGPDDSWAREMQQFAHDREVAFVIEDDVALAHRIGADGVHISADPSQYRHARDLLGNGAIVGVDCRLVRHDAMVLADMGADYIAFGTSAASGTGGRDRRDELVAWWAGTFEVPCVAMDAESAEEAETLAQAGADFIALTETIWQAGDAARLVGAVGAALRKDGSDA